MKRLAVKVLTTGLAILSLTCGDPQGPLGVEPPTASQLTATVQGSGAPSVLLTWTQCPDDDFAWYTVYRSETAGIASEPASADTSFIVSGQSSTSWTDLGVDQGETWHYAVKTTDTEDQVAWSNEATVVMPDNDPPTPSIVSVSYTGDSQWPQITVSWTACMDPDFHSYSLYRSLIPDIASDPLEAELLKVFQESDDMIYEDNNLAGETPYYYALLTWDQGEMSSWSNEASLTTPQIIPIMTVFFIDPGYGSLSGDATLIRTPENHWYLIDGGDKNSSWSCGENRILPLLDSLGVQELDGIVGTHPHADHIGGLIAVLEAIPVVTVWDSGYEYTTQTYFDYIDAIWENGSDYVTPRRGDMLDWDDQITVECVHPVDPLFDGGDPVNNASVTLRITYGDVSFLFTGDLETDGGEEVILAALGMGYIDDLTADVLKVGHHGSSTSTSQAWLNAVQPSIAAIEVGAGNPYGHPHPTVISRLQNFGADIYRTDLDGTFIITTDGSTLNVYP